MTIMTEPSDRSLHITPLRQSAPEQSESWKKLIGQRPVPARLSTLPQQKLSWRALGTSTVFQAAVAAALVAIPVFFPQRLVTQIEYEVTPISAPMIEVPVPRRQPVVRARVQPTPPLPVEQPQPQPHIAKLIAPAPLARPKVTAPRVRNAEVPRLDQTLTDAKFETPVAEPVRPREPVKVGNLSTGSAEPQTIHAPVEKVQTGGFGDPDGVGGNGDPNRRTNIARVGSFALPPGPGYGNGTGGATGVRGAVASAGFGNGVAIPPSGGMGNAHGTVKSSGFQSAEVTADAPRAKQQADAPPPVQAVVILAKPNPVYTDEARKLRIEGEVLVQVVFPPSGPVRVVRVTKGLGHGLDEAAMRAAEQIKFKPALQNGQPVDFPATVHIEFQLAF